MEGRGTAFGKPAVPSAVQYLHVGVAVVLQHPPHACRHQVVVVVVGHDEGVVGHPEPAHELLELLRRHDEGAVVGAGRAVLLDVVVHGQVDGARDVRAAIGLEHRTVDHADVGIIEVGGQPVRLGEQFGVGVFGHGVSRGKVCGVYPRPRLSG